MKVEISPSGGYQIQYDITRYKMSLGLQIILQKFINQLLEILMGILLLRMAGGDLIF